MWKTIENLFPFRQDIYFCIHGDTYFIYKWLTLSSHFSWEQVRQRWSRVSPVSYPAAHLSGLEWTPGVPDTMSGQTDILQSDDKIQKLTGRLVKKVKNHVNKDELIFSWYVAKKILLWNFILQRHMIENFWVVHRLPSHN